MPNEAFAKRFRSVRKAVQWIADIDGCSLTAALLQLSTSLASGDVQSVDQHAIPIPRYHYPIRLRKLVVGLSRGPEHEIFISGEDLLKWWPPKHPGSPTAGDETRAIEFLAERLRADPHLTHAAALKMCRESYPKLSECGFRSRVWPKAREAAGLAPIALAGRKPKR